MSERSELVAEIDLALAALRRVIVRALALQEAPAATAPILPPRPPPAAAVKPVPRPVISVVATAANGVTYDADTRTVSFAGAGIVVSPRQAQVLMVLARALPNVIPRAEIIRRAWPDMLPSSGETLLSGMREPLDTQLRTIGLQLKAVPKFGLALQPAE